MFNLTFLRPSSIPDAFKKCLHIAFNYLGPSKNISEGNSRNFTLTIVYKY